MLKKSAIILMVMWLVTVVFVPSLTCAQDVQEHGITTVDPFTRSGITDTTRGDHAERLVGPRSLFIVLAGDQPNGTKPSVTPSTLIRRREPIVAGLLSWLWPGLGQSYNGPTEKKKGAIMALTDGGLWVVELVGVFNPITHDHTATDIYGDTYTYQTQSINPLLWVGLAGLLGNGIYSIYDAVVRAEEINAANGVSVTPSRFPGHSVGLVIDPTRLPHGQVGVRAVVQMQF